jgi:hypothetical protein
MVRLTKNSIVIEIENLENPFEKWVQLNSGFSSVMSKILKKKEVDIESKEFKSLCEFSYWIALKKDNILSDDADIY